MKRKMRRTPVVLLILVALLLSTLLPGCAASPPSPAPTSPSATVAPPAPTSAVATPAPGEAQGAEVITAVLGHEPDTLMPFMGSMLAQTQLLGTLWTDLVERDEQDNYVAWGAESVPTVDNGGAKFVGEGADKHLEITYKIKKGLKWHDGTPVTSKDVKFTVELVQNPAFPTDHRELALKIAEVMTPDDQTVVVEFMSENQAREAAREGWKLAPADLYEAYAEQSGPVVDPLYFLAADLDEHILPAHVLGGIAPEDMAKSEFARQPIGNGPYKLKQWTPGQSLVVEAADTSLFGEPKTQTVVFKVIPDGNAVINSLTTGEAQIATSVGLALDQSPDLDKLEQDGKITAYYVPTNAWEHLYLNLNDEILAEKSVRQAIIHAMDRQTIVDKVLFGKSAVMHSWIAAPHWALDDAALVKYEYSPSKAKQLLDEAGWKLGADGVRTKDGQTLTIKLDTTNSNVRQQVGQLIQANLKEVGIEVEAEYIPGGGLFEANGPIRTRTFAMALFTSVTDPDPDPSDTYHSNGCPQGGNFTCWKNEVADELMAQAASTLSEQERKPLYSQLLRIWTDEVPTIPIYQAVKVSATATSVEGYKPGMSTTPDTWNIHEWFLPAK